MWLRARAVKTLQGKSLHHTHVFSSQGHRGPSSTCRFRAQTRATSAYNNLTSTRKGQRVCECLQTRGADPEEELVVEEREHEVDSSESVLESSCLVVPSFSF
mmetsp:Transcript_129920/g.323764  ORF Transcript_129920/g.323764 Transcript_129920/m.323764 type:complete len:102 (-) Transcript_129920:876-1181(-)